MSKKLHIKTYGCQMNVYDSLKMQKILAPFGYTSTENQDEADMFILNTCHIKEKKPQRKCTLNNSAIKKIKDVQKKIITLKPLLLLLDA